MTLNELLANLAKNINKNLNKELFSASDFVTPPDQKLGDLALPMFKSAKELDKTPVELAKQLATDLKITEAQLEASGPYLNFILEPAVAQELLASLNAEENILASQKDTKGEVMIEYSNINTHKEYHLGHLRNIAYGDAVNRIYQADGFKVWPVSYVNDFGGHVAKTIWGLKTGLVKMDEADSASKGFLLGQAYVAATSALEDNEAGKKEVSEIMQNIEARTGEDYDLWLQTRQWSIDYFANIYGQLNVEFAEQYYESEYIDKGRELVNELLAKGILKESQGAIIADLEEYNLGVLVIIRSDGTALYPVADLALAQEKFKRHNLDKSFYVVDIRQALYFKQLFKVLELLGYKAEMVHLGYDFVKLPSGMMSSRTGNTVLYKDLYQAIFDKFKAEIMERHEDWQEAEIVETANKLTIGTLKFEMLKVGSEKTITFDIKEALKFDGFTATYLEYTVARLNSVLRKGDYDAKISADLSLLVESLEKSLTLKMCQLPNVVALAAETKNPSELAKYLFDLAREFNDYYQGTQLIVENTALKQARLSILANIKKILKTGLDLLGIEIVEKM